MKKRVRVSPPTHPSTHTPFNVVFIPISMYGKLKLKFMDKISWIGSKFRAESSLNLERGGGGLLKLTAVFLFWIKMCWYLPTYLEKGDDQMELSVHLRLLRRWMSNFQFDILTFCYTCLIYNSSTEFKQ